MSIRGFDLAQARYDRSEPPQVPDLTDDPGTACPGLISVEDGMCDERSTCPLCNSVVCRIHDDGEDCEGFIVHPDCHQQGCTSAECADDARDAALLQRADEEAGR